MRHNFVVNYATFLKMRKICVKSCKMTRLPLFAVQKSSIAQLKLAADCVVDFAFTFANLTCYS